MHASYLSDYWIFLLIGFCVFVYLFFDISYIGYVSGRFRWPLKICIHCIKVPKNNNNNSNRAVNKKYNDIQLYYSLSHVK